MKLKIGKCSHRCNYIHRWGELKPEKYKTDTDIVCEDLNRVKHASKLYKSTNNKLQYWSYKQVLDKLNSLSELKGFKLIKVEPAYTSQICSKCGQIIKANRNRRTL